jgi:glutamyl-tRNA synthetase
VRTRFAPTPSGFLHIGNCVNALLVSRLASTDGEVVLRIDDADQLRYRSAYADDIFRTLDWLEIRLDLGPRSTRELERDFSQTYRRANYLQAAHQAMDMGLAYACGCPRGFTECFCDDGRVWTPGNDALRLKASHSGLGAVLWRRDDVPAYHLTSIVDDDDFEITHVVRGDDLQESTQIQSTIAAALLLTFPADVRHHTLVLDERGAKLSKSTGSHGPLTHDNQLQSHIRSLADDIGASIGVVSTD